MIMIILRSILLLAIIFSIGTAKSEIDSRQKPILLSKLADDFTLSVHNPEGVETIRLSMDTPREVIVTRKTDPNILQLSIPKDTALMDKFVTGSVFTYSSPFISSIQIGKGNSDFSTIELSTKGLVDYSTKVVDNVFYLYLKTPNYFNIEYHAKGDRKYFILSNTLLANEINTKKLYTCGFDLTDPKIFRMKFPTSLSKLGEGNFLINDEYIWKMSITNDSFGESSITIFAKQNFFFEPLSRGITKDTAINFFPTHSREDMLVVIDPGHGGVETGAINQHLVEKDINLIIATELAKKLKEMNINTWMTRNDDSYVGLYERGYIAKDMGAVLFLSIHNNSYSSYMRGTETLYSSKYFYPFSSKKFAQIVQDNLLEAFDTPDRKIVERNNLVVLNAPEMPSVIAELAFLSNPNDMFLFENEDFSQITVKALANSVYKALQLLGKY